MRSPMVPWTFSWDSCSKLTVNPSAALATYGLRLSAHRGIHAGQVDAPRSGNLDIGVAFTGNDTQRLGYLDGNLDINQRAANAPPRPHRLAQLFSGHATEIRVEFVRGQALQGDDGRYAMDNVAAGTIDHQRSSPGAKQAGHRLGELPPLSKERLKGGGTGKGQLSGGTMEDVRRCLSEGESDARFGLERVRIGKQTRAKSPGEDRTQRKGRSPL